jgi:hypothetical protein
MKRFLPKKRLRKKKAGQNRSVLIKVFVLSSILIISILTVGLFRAFNERTLFKSFKKEIIAVQLKKGDVVVAVFDKERDKIYRIHIPGDTSIASSRNLGEWKIKSLRVLGENENLDGKLLTETLTRSFSYQCILGPMKAP